MNSSRNVTIKENKMKILFECEYFRIWVDTNWLWAVETYPHFKSFYLGYLNITIFN